MMNRVTKAVHTCYLQATQGEPQRVCCSEGSFADSNRTIPGFVSGYPARTRHLKDDARVFYSESSLTLSSEGGSSTSYEISLGSTPFRGAVWIDISVSSSADFEVLVEPSRAVLYDNMTSVPVVVSIADGATAIKSTQNMLILHTITSCGKCEASCCIFHSLGDFRLIPRPLYFWSSTQTTLS